MARGKVPRARGLRRGLLLRVRGDVPARDEEEDRREHHGAEDREHEVAHELEPAVPDGSSRRRVYEA